jgi:hypothetical protein
LLTAGADQVIESIIKRVYTVDEVNAIDSKDSSILESKATMQENVLWHERC